MQSEESGFQAAKNPNLLLIESLRKAGAEVLVRGPALGYKKIDRSQQVSPSVPVAAAAFSVLMNQPMDAYSYLPVQ